MFEIKKEWKEFYVNTAIIDSYMRENLGSEYSGFSADKNIRFIFLEKPDKSTIDKLNNYWNSINENSESAQKYFSQEDFKASLNSAKEDIIFNNKDWKDLTNEQKKILLGLNLSLKEKLIIVSQFNN